jgi:hypothetical protein
MSDESRPLDDFKLSDEEALVLAVAKHWLMAEDVERDDDEKRLLQKRAVLADYRSRMRETFARELSGENIPDPDPDAIAARLLRPDWAPALRHSRRS